MSILWLRLPHIGDLLGLLAVRFYSLGEVLDLSLRESNGLLLIHIDVAVLVSRLLLLLVLASFSNQHLAFERQVLVPRGRLPSLIELCSAAQRLGRLLLVLDGLIAGGGRVLALDIHGFGLGICTAIAYGGRPACESAVGLCILILRAGRERFIITILHIRRLVGNALLGRQVNARLLRLFNFDKRLIIVAAPVVDE